MKTILEFSSPDDDFILQEHLNAHKHALIVDQLWDRIFRPYFKHGYSDLPEELAFFVQNSDDLRKFMDFLSNEYHALISEVSDND